MPVAVAGPVEAHTKIPAGDAGRVLRIADAADPGWQATLDGRALTPKTARRLGAGLRTARRGRHARPHLRRPPSRHTAWVWTQGALGVVLVVLALPGRRREIDDDLPEETEAVAGRSRSPGRAAGRAGCAPRPRRRPAAPARRRGGRRDARRRAGTPDARAPRRTGRTPTPTDRTRSAQQDAVRTGVAQRRRRTATVPRRCPATRTARHLRGGRQDQARARTRVRRRRLRPQQTYGGREPYQGDRPYQGGQYARPAVPGRTLRSRTRTSSRAPTTRTATPSSSPTPRAAQPPRTTADGHDEHAPGPGPWPHGTDTATHRDGESAVKSHHPVPDRGRRRPRRRHRLRRAHRARRRAARRRRRPPPGCPSSAPACSARRPAPPTWRRPTYTSFTPAGEGRRRRRHRRAEGGRGRCPRTRTTGRRQGRTTATDKATDDKDDADGKEKAADTKPVVPLKDARQAGHRRDRQRPDAPALVGTADRQARPRLDRPADHHGRRGRRPRPARRSAAPLPTPTSGSPARAPRGPPGLRPPHQPRRHRRRRRPRAVRQGRPPQVRRRARASRSRPSSSVPVLLSTLTGEAADNVAVHVTARSGPRRRRRAGRRRRARQRLAGRLRRPGGHAWCCPASRRTPPPYAWWPSRPARTTPI